MSFATQSAAENFTVATTWANPSRSSNDGTTAGRAFCNDNITVTRPIYRLTNATASPIVITCSNRADAALLGLWNLNSSIGSGYILRRVSLGNPPWSVGNFSMAAETVTVPANGYVDYTLYAIGWRLFNTYGIVTANASVSMNVAWTINGAATNIPINVSGSLSANMSQSGGVSESFNPAPSIHVITLAAPPPAVGRISVQAIAGSSVVIVRDDLVTGESVLITEITDGTVTDYVTANCTGWDGDIIEIRVAGALVHTATVPSNAVTAGFVIEWVDPSLDLNNDGSPDGIPSESPVQPSTGPSQSPVNPPAVTDLVDKALARPVKPAGSTSSANDATPNDTVKKSYWAVRDAVEDALGGGLSGADIGDAMKAIVGIPGSVDLQPGEGSTEGQADADALGRATSTIKGMRDAFSGADPILPTWGFNPTYTLPLGALGSTTLSTNTFQPYVGHLRKVFEFLIWVYTTLNVLGSVRSVIAA